MTLIKFILHIDKYLTALIQTYGSFIYCILFAIIFIETGLVLMPFLPGDSLLFVTGAIAATGALNIFLLFFLLFSAAVIGDNVNYWLGRYFGEKVFSRFIKQEHMDKTKTFFHKYGKKAIIIARFIPIIRTFTPFVAGIGHMQYATYLAYDILGGFAWISIFLFSGYFFGNIPIIKHNLTIVVLIIIFISILPIIREYLNHKKNKT